MGTETVRALAGAGAHVTIATRNPALAEPIVKEFPRSRRWAEDGIHANACAPGSIHTNLTRHLDTAILQVLGAVDADGNVITPDYYKTPEQGAATSTLLAASPLLEGVTGRYFQDNQETGTVEDGPALMAAGGPGAMVGVAEWAVDPTAADRLWEYALTTVRDAAKDRLPNVRR